MSVGNIRSMTLAFYFLLAGGLLVILYSLFHQHAETAASVSVALSETAANDGGWVAAILLAFREVISKMGDVIRGTPE